MPPDELLSHLSEVSIPGAGRCGRVDAVVSELSFVPIVATLAIAALINAQSDWHSRH